MYGDENLQNHQNPPKTILVEPTGSPSESTHKTQHSQSDPQKTSLIKPTGNPSGLIHKPIELQVLRKDQIFRY